MEEMRRYQSLLGFISAPGTRADQRASPEPTGINSGLPSTPATDANAQNIPAMARAKRCRARTSTSVSSSNASLTGSATVLVCASHSHRSASVSVRLPRVPAFESEGYAAIAKAVLHPVCPVHAHPEWDRYLLSRPGRLLAEQAKGRVVFPLC